MRLIDVHSLVFEEFFEERIPPYAILSHRWSDDEVSYKDFLNERKHSSTGYQKVRSFCDLVRTRLLDDKNNPLHWAWVDTCCIDKESSAELSEAINSMFRWYRKANVCIVHLADFKSPRPGEAASMLKGLAACTWFTRGCKSPV